MNFKEFPNEDNNKYDIYVSALRNGNYKQRNIIYKYIDGKAYDMQTHETFYVALSSPEMHVVSGSMAMCLDGLIEKMIEEGKLKEDFDYNVEGNVILNEFLKTKEFKISSLNTQIPNSFAGASSYVDSDIKDNKIQM